VADLEKALGRTRHPRLIVAGRDVRAVDVACCDLISVPLERVRHLERVPYRAVGRAVSAKLYVGLTRGEGIGFKPQQRP
jgi:uncharacterized protein (DUF362 family)